MLFTLKQKKDEEENVTLCTAAIVIRTCHHSPTSNQQRCYCVWILWLINMCPKTSASCIMLSNWHHNVQSKYTLILVLVVFARCIIKTWMVPVQSHKLLTFLSSPLVWGHIYIWPVETFISVRGHTHKNINITMCTNTCLLLNLPIGQSWWSRMKIEHVRFFL